MRKECFLQVSEFIRVTFETAGYKTTSPQGPSGSRSVKSHGPRQHMESAQLSWQCSC